MWTFIGIGTAVIGILGALAFYLLPRVGAEPARKKFGGTMAEAHGDAFGKRQDEGLPKWMQPSKQKRIKGPPDRTQINDRQGSGATGRNLTLIGKQ